MADNIQEMKCPSCGAPISLDEGVEAVVCEYCGTKVFVDDEIYKYQRMLKAQSEVRRKDDEARYELEKEREGYETRRKIVTAFTNKPLECSAVLLCTIWLITKAVSRNLALAHILIEAGVIMWALGAEKRPVAITNIGIYFRNNKKQAFVFAFSAITIFACIANDFGAGMFLISLCCLIWSIKSGKKTGLIIDSDSSVKYLYVRNSALHYTGMQCTNVMEELRACGFTDIHTIQKRDLVKGWFAKVGDVASISINGISNFEEGREFPSDARVVIEYHTF